MDTLPARLQAATRLLARCVRISSKSSDAEPRVRVGAGPPRVIDHVHLRVSDLDASGRFYDLVLGPLGLRRSDEHGMTIRYRDFIISEGDGPPSRDAHIAFAAADREQVDAYHRAGVEAGHPSNGAPGLRARYAPDYYGAFLLDPDGHNIEAVFWCPPH